MSYLVHGPGIITMPPPGKSLDYSQLNDATTAALVAYRNKIHNGDFRIDQRNNGAALADSAGASPYTLDRWRIITRTGATITAQQGVSGGGPTRWHHAVIITSGKTPVAADQFRLTQAVEGLNWADMWYGAAAARVAALSFSSCHSVAGTYSGSLLNADSTRSFVFTYTQNVADAWESKSVIVPGDTTGTWLTTNAMGCALSFDYGSGSQFDTATVGSWIAGAYLRATGTLRPVQTNGTIFRIEGVQLEPGNIVTPLEIRPISMELVLCQRYYEPGRILAAGYQGDNTNPAGLFIPVAYRVTKRAPPTLTFSNRTTAGPVLGTVTGLAFGESAVGGFLAYYQTSAAGNYNVTENYYSSAEL